MLDWLAPLRPRDTVDRDLLYYAGFCAAAGFAFMLVGLVFRWVIPLGSAIAVWSGFWLCCSSVVIASFYVVRRLLRNGFEE